MNRSRYRPKRAVLDLIATLPEEGWRCIGSWEVGVPKLQDLELWQRAYDMGAVDMAQKYVTIDGTRYVMQCARRRNGPPTQYFAPAPLPGEWKPR